MDRRAVTADEAAQIRRDWEEFVNPYFLFSLIRVVSSLVSVLHPPLSMCRDFWFYALKPLTGQFGNAICSEPEVLCQSRTPLHLWRTGLLSPTGKPLCFHPHSQTEWRDSNPTPVFAQVLWWDTAWLYWNQHTNVLRQGGSWKTVTQRQERKTSAHQMFHHYPRYFSGFSQNRSWWTERRQS